MFDTLRAAFVFLYQFTSFTLRSPFDNMKILEVSDRMRALVVINRAPYVPCESIAHWMQSRGIGRSRKCRSFLLHKPLPTRTPAIGVKLAELSIRGTYAVDLIHEKQRPYFRAVLYRKIVPFSILRYSIANPKICFRFLFYST